MKVAIFSSFNCHFEMFGYIIHYCKQKGFDLTIYCPIEPTLLHLLDNGYIELYKNIFGDKGLQFRSLIYFEQEKKNFDFFFLPTDDDTSFNTNNNIINDTTICIEHSNEIRRDIFKKRVATRPFPAEFFRNWALPCYPIIRNGEINRASNTDYINVALLGFTDKYNTNTINRLKCDKKINIIFIARRINTEGFDNIRDDITIYINENMETNNMFALLKSCHYILTDYHKIDDVHEDKSMSGSIPLSFSILLPMIISKQMNNYYHFENVIEYNKKTNDDILLTPVDPIKIEIERDAFIKKNHALFDTYIGGNQRFPPYPHPSIE